MDDTSSTQMKDTPGNKEQHNNDSLMAGMGTNRIGAFSDGVFAIALTLLILEIKVPILYILPGRIDRYWANQHKAIEAQSR